MKLPTEGELIELENWIANLGYLLGDAQPSAIRSNLSTDRAIEQIQLLIDLARAQLSPIPPMPPRRPAPKLSVVVQPKKKERKQSAKGS